MKPQFRGTFQTFSSHRVCLARTKKLMIAQTSIGGQEVAVAASRAHAYYSSPHSAPFGIVNKNRSASLLLGITFILTGNAENDGQRGLEERASATVETKRKTKGNRRGMRTEDGSRGEKKMAAADGRAGQDRERRLSKTAGHCSNCGEWRHRSPWCRRS